MKNITILVLSCALFLVNACSGNSTKEPTAKKEKHAITLMITSTSGSKAEVTLTNKKVPAEIEK